MKKLLLFLVFGSVICGTLLAQSGIQSAEISFVFISKDVEGSIGGFKSESSIDPDQFTASQLKGSVDVETLRTGNFLRDWSLKSSKYFDADEFPRISFESKEIAAQATGFKVTGLLKIKGTTKEITMDLNRDGNRLSGTMRLFSSDFGIDIKKKREDNLVEVELSLVLEP